MATPRTPQDRKAPEKRTTAAKTLQRKPTSAEMAASPVEGASRAEKVAAASKAAARRSRGAAAEGRSSVKSEDLASEVAPDLVEKPEGCPEFRLLVALSRRERASYLRAIDVLTSRAQGSKELQAIDVDADPEVIERRLERSGSVFRVTADLAEMAADVEDLLRVVAVDVAEYDAWAADAPDEVLLQAFGWFQQESQPGEA